MAILVVSIKSSHCVRDENRFSGGGGGGGPFGFLLALAVVINVRYADVFLLFWYLVTHLVCE